MSQQSPLKMVSETHASRKEAQQAHFDKLWHQDPNQFNPFRNSMEQERIERTWDAITQSKDLKGCHAADLGCGSGIFSQRLHLKGASVDALDISQKALNILKENSHQEISTHQGCLPKTTLPDDTYDLVLCLDVIGYLHPNEHRLLFSELARIVKPNGTIYFSTPIDLDSEDAIEKLKKLSQTELQIEKWFFSYHRLYIHLLDFFEAPRRFAKAMRDPNYRTEQLKKRFAFWRLWFRIQSQKPLGWIWKPVSWIFYPIYQFLNQSQQTLFTLEKISKLLFGDRGISHAIMQAKRRPLIEEQSKEIPQELKHKKQLWE